MTTEGAPTPLIIEAAINGGITTLAANPHVPYTPEQVATDAISAHEAGASVVHFHVREADGSRIDDYARLLAQHVATMHAIRGQPSPLLWNTFPLGGNCEQRFRLFRDLSGRSATRPDVGAHDIGSLNIVSYDETTEKASASTYINTFEDVRYFLTGFRELGLRPFLNVFEPGFIRTARICLQLGLLDEPLLVKFYFSNDYGLPLSPRSIEAYLSLLEGVRFEWFGCFIGADVLPFVPLIASMGGHVRLGLEDFDYAATGRLSNAEIVQRARAAALESGRSLATVDDARRILALRAT
jgi:uncharacterized protein (DUF849 family)